jgi:phosphate transport system permease protein
MSSDKQRPRRTRSTYSSLTAHGEPWVWLTGGALALAIMMITGLLAFIAIRGASTFWPVPLELVELSDGRRALGEVTEREKGQATTAKATGRGSRRLVRTANFEVSGNHYEWFDDTAIARVSRPEWATVVERLEGGRFHGFPVRLLHGEEVVATGPEEAWKAYEREHPVVRRRWREAMRIDRHERGQLQRQLRAARLAVVQAGLDSRSTPPGAGAVSKVIAPSAAFVL